MTLSDTTVKTGLCAQIPKATLYCVESWLFQISKNAFKVLGTQPLQFLIILSPGPMPFVTPSGVLLFLVWGGGENGV